MQVGYMNRGVWVWEYYGGMIDEIEYLDDTVPINIGEKNTFFIQNVGGEYWEVGRNGKSTVRFNAHALYGFAPETGIEFYAAKAKFPLLNFYPAIEVLTEPNSAWVAPEKAIISYRGKWSIEGMLQNPALRKNELNMGGSVPQTTDYYLW